jgi:hypothetical protein
LLGTTGGGLLGVSCSGADIATPEFRFEITRPTASPDAAAATREAIIIPFIINDMPALAAEAAAALTPAAADEAAAADASIAILCKIAILLCNNEDVSYHYSHTADDRHRSYRHH